MNDRTIPIFPFKFNRCRVFDEDFFTYLELAKTRNYEGHAKSSVTNRLPKFYPRYILKCFTALEWCVE